MRRFENEKEMLDYIENEFRKLDDIEAFIKMVKKLKHNSDTYLKEVKKLNKMQEKIEKMTDAYFEEKLCNKVEEIAFEHYKQIIELEKDVIVL